MQRKIDSWSPSLSPPSSKRPLKNEAQNQIARCPMPMINQCLPSMPPSSSYRRFCLRPRRLRLRLRLLVLLLTTRLDSALAFALVLLHVRRA